MYTRDVYRYGGQVILSYELKNGTRLYVEGTLGKSGSRIFLVDHNKDSLTSRELSGPETKALIGVNFK